jgi:hypothetical protein
VGPQSEQGSASSGPLEGSETGSGWQGVTDLALQPSLTRAIESGDRETLSTVKELLAEHKAGTLRSVVTWTITISLSITVAVAGLLIYLHQELRAELRELRQSSGSAIHELETKLEKTIEDRTHVGSEPTEAKDTAR